jgi:hypothetical protein
MYLSTIKFIILIQVNKNAYTSFYIVHFYNIKNYFRPFINLLIHYLKVPRGPSPSNIIGAIMQSRRCLESQFVWNMSGKFSPKGTVNRHKVTHTHEKPFKCNIYKLLFSLKKHLISHIYIWLLILWRNYIHATFVKKRSHLNKL